MPTQLELAAKVAYEKFNENLIGCCEDAWEDTDESFKLRMIESMVAALMFLREPTDAQYYALCAIGKPWNEQNSRGVWTTYIDTLVKNA